MYNNNQYFFPDFYQLNFVPTIILFLFFLFYKKVKLFIIFIYYYFILN